MRDEENPQWSKCIRCNTCDGYPVSCQRAAHGPLLMIKVRSWL